MDFERLWKSWWILVLCACLLPATAAGMVWLGSLLTSLAPVPVLAPLGIGLLAVLWAPLLWCGLSRLKRGSSRLERFQAEQIIRHAAESILTVSNRGQILSLNPAAEQLFGYRSAEICNQPITMLLTEAQTGEHRKLLHDSLPVGSILGLAAGACEMLGHRKNGDTFPLEMTIGSLPIQGDPVSVMFARDVSKRKEAQRYLTAHYAATCVLAEAGALAEALPGVLQSICEALRWEAGACWQIDRDAGLLRCTELYQAPVPAGTKPLEPATLTGKPDQGLPGHVWSSGKPVWVEDLLRDLTSGPRDCPCLGLAVPLQLHAAFAIPIVLGQEVCGVLTFFNRRVQKRDDRLLQILSVLGEQLGQLMARERHEEVLRRSEESLHETTQTLQALVQAAPVAIHIIDLEGKVLLWNPAAERMLGYTAAEVLNHPLPTAPANAWVKGQTPGVREDSSGFYPTGVLAGETYHGVGTRRRKKDGTVIEVSMSSAPLRNPEGAVFGTMSILMDLTEQKRLEDSLRQAQKMEAVGQLAGGVAHDFNNLLTIITGYCDMLLGNVEASETTREYLGQIQKAGERAASLTRQLLAFGRKQTFQLRVLDLNAIIENLAKMLPRLIGEDVEMILRPTPLDPVKADPGQIEQIVLNLATNARDAMPNGGRLTIRTANVVLARSGAAGPGASQLPLPEDVAPGPYVMIEVSDTGMGMDEATRGRIFEPFFTTKEVGKGTGLGLSTVYGIVKQFLGHIEVDSEPGQGSRFRVYLRRLEEVGERSSARKQTSALPRGNETLLIVEDEDSVRRVVNHVLRSSGYTVLEARSGKEALQLCAEHKGEIALLVTDVIMPHMNGRQLADEAVLLQENMKVLFMSGYADTILDKQGTLTDGIAFLQKPLTPLALANKVREVLDAPSRTSRP
jgi:PAS domain S-box-containing protein